MWFVVMWFSILWFLCGYVSACLYVGSVRKKFPDVCTPDEEDQEFMFLLILAGAAGLTAIFLSCVLTIKEIGFSMNWRNKK